MLSLEDEVNMVMGQYLGAFEGFLGKFPSAYAVSSTLGIALNGRERVDVIGALLGFYGALSALALTHHWVIWFVAAQVYPGVPFTRYTILGDNIIIRDERVAECYRELIPPLNVPFSLEKSLVSSVGALEFGKRFFVRRVTKDFFPVSCHMLRSLVSSISLIPVMRAIMSNNHPLSFHLWEAGYRVYTRSTAPLYDSGQKVVHKSVADLFFYHVFLMFSLKHAGILLASGDIDPKLEYGPCVVFLLYHDESTNLMEIQFKINKEAIMDQDPNGSILLGGTAQGKEKSMLWPSSLWALNLDTSSGPSCMDLGLLNGFAEDRIPYPMSLARLLGTFGLGFLRPI
ncbi:hypothetical protein FXO38_17501 [Capsicum annuum]|nr:hypothetical protein FXO38_17501 [Capsicum annuum]